MRITVRHLAATVAGFSILLVTALMAGCNSMNHVRCDDRVVSKEGSPDGRFVALSYARRCANNTGLYTWVGLEETSRTEESKGESEPVLTIQGIHNIKLVWQNSRSLAVELPKLLDGKGVVTQMDSWRTVTISYSNSPQ
jgi:hypothetical protein